MELLCETANLSNAISAEQQLPPGDYEIRLYTLNRLSDAKIGQLYQALSGGVQLLGPIEEHIRQPTYYIKFRISPQQGISIAPAILALIPTAIIAVLIGIGIFRIESITRSLLPLAVTIVGGVLILAALLRKPATEYVTRRY